MREKFSASQTSHDNRRQQLDLQLAEIDELRRALSDQADELQNATVRRAQDSDVAQAVAELEKDLARVRREAVAFGQDLRKLKEEKEDVEEKEKVQRAEVRRARDEVRKQREEVGKLKKKWEGHVCNGYVRPSSPFCHCSPFVCFQG